MSALADTVEGLRQRVQDVLGGQPVTVGPPVAEVSDAAGDGETDGDGDAGATVTVLDVTPRHALSPDRGLLGLRVRCLVAPRAKAPWDELAALLVAFAADPCHDLAAEAPSLELWRAYGVVPRPALVVESTVHEVLEVETAPLVLEPMRLDVVGVRAIDGQVVGPGGVALPGAVVRLARTGARVTAGRDGRFQLAVPPGHPGPLAVELKGRTIVIEPPDPVVEPIVIRIERLED